MRSIRTMPFAVPGLVFVLVALTSADPANAQVDPDMEKAQRLITKIRKQMKEIDEALLATKDPKGVSDILDQNIKDIEELLDAIEDMQSQVINDMDELVKMAKYQQSQCNNPSDSRSQQQQRQQEQQAQREKSKDPKDLSQQEQPQPQDKKPQGGEESRNKPQQDETTQPPPQGEIGVFERWDISDRWGVLPSKEAEDLINADVSKFPERYRRWLDAYYRRVNERRR